MASRKRRSSAQDSAKSPWWSDTDSEKKSNTRKKSEIPTSTGGDSRKENSEFDKIIGINDEGHPYVDLNKLVFHPKAQDATSKLKLSDYAPDFGFIIFNLVTVGISIYFIIMSYSTLEWQESIRMFSIPNCHALVLSSKSDGMPSNASGVQASKNRKLENVFYLPCVEFLNSESFKGKTEKYEFNGPVTFPIFRTWLVQPDSLAVVLIVTEIVNLFNVVFGISGCLKGIKAILIQHMIVNGVVITMEFIISILITVTGNCDKDDLGAARLLLTHYVRWYGVTISTPSKQSEKERQLNAQVDALQIGLNCCGMDGWADYLPAGYPNYFRPLENAHFDGDAAIIPYSCCRRWWVRNVFCAQGAHQWSGPTATEEEATRFHDRIVQDGCLYKLEKFCDTMVLFNGFYAVRIVIFHMALTGGRIFAGFKLIKNIDKMVESHKEELERKDMMHHQRGETKGGINLKNLKERHLGGLLAQLAPPTEDEVYAIKERSNFNKFTAAMKGGEVEQWMKKARQKVTKGQDREQEPEAQTALEKKAREKELLHGKVKKEYQAKLPEIKAEQPVVEKRKSVGFMSSTKVKKKKWIKIKRSKESVTEEEEEPKRRKKKRRRRKKKHPQGKKPWWNWF